MTEKEEQRETNKKEIKKLRVKRKKRGQIEERGRRYREKIQREEGKEKMKRKKSR